MMTKKRTALWIAVFSFWMAALSLIAAEDTSAVENDSAQSEISSQPLRNPFWPLDYFPANWKTIDSETGLSGANDGADWRIPAEQIIVTGTSQMRDQTVAIINGEMKSPGDLIIIRYNGRIYQWKLKTIKPDGRIQLERHSVQPDTGEF